MSDLLYRHPRAQFGDVRATLDKARDDTTEFVVTIRQDGGAISIPFKDWGRFVDACEALYTNGGR